MFYYYASQKEPFENRIANRIVSLQFTSAVSVLETEGLDGLNRMTSGWPAVDQRHIAIIPLKVPLTQRAGPMSMIPLTDDVRLEHVKGETGAITCSSMTLRLCVKSTDLTVLGEC